MRHVRLARAAAALSTVGPGLFLIGYNIGTGSVTTMAKTGANYGMTLFWALVLSCFFTFVLMVAYGKLTLVTGRTALWNIKSELRWCRVGTGLALYTLVALVFGEILALMGIMGIVSDLLQEGTRMVSGGEGIGTIWITTVLAVGLYALLWNGNYSIFEKFLSFFVIFMGLCFVIVFIMVKPSLGMILSGMIPSIPHVDGALGIVAAIAGTTCSAAVFIMRSTVVAEKGWDIESLSKQKRDAFVSAGLMLLLSGTIMAVAAGTLYTTQGGEKLVNTVDLIRILEPLGGNVAAVIMIFGITGAGLSTVFPILLIAPWLICDYTNRPRDIRSPLFRTLGLAGLLFAFAMFFIGHRPVALMVFSQAFQACILPAVAIPAFILINRGSVMGEHRAGWCLNLGMAGVVLFSFVTTYFAIAEVIPKFAGFLAWY